MNTHQPIAGILRELAKAEYQALPAERLLDRYTAHRDEAALVERYAGLVYRRCLAVLRRDDLARDAFQETFRALVRHAHRLRRPGAVGPWLNTTAYRQAVTLRRRERRRARREVAVTAEPHDHRGAPAAAFAERRESTAAVTAALAALPDRYRLPLELVYLDGKTHAEAAAVLGRPKGTVDAAVKRGLDRLRSALGRAGLLSAIGAVEVVLAGQARAVPADLLAAAVRAAAVEPPGPASPWAGWVPGRRVAVGLVAAAVVAVGGVVGLWAGGRRPPPPEPPPAVEPDPEPLADRNLRLFRADILPRMAAELKPLAFNGGEVVVTASSATDTRVFAEFEARHVDAPLGVKTSRLRVAFDTVGRTEWIYLDEEGTGVFHLIKPDKPWVLFRVKELNFEVAVPSEPLRRARAVLAELPPDPRAGPVAAEHARRLRAAIGPLLGLWYVAGDRKRPVAVTLSEEDVTLQTLLRFGAYGPFLADLTPRPDGGIDYANVAWTTTRLSPDGRRLTFEPSGEWWEKAD